MKKLICIILTLALCVTLLTACVPQQITGQGSQSTPTPAPTPAGNLSTNQDDETISITCDSWTTTITKFDQKGEDDAVNVNIILADSNTAIDGSGAIYKDGYVVITAAGTYSVTGTLTNGAIIIDLPSTDKVHLILKGVSITSSEYAAICVIAGDKVCITLAEGTTNTLTDSSTYTYKYSALVEPSSCLFSKQDLTINGTGTLVVNGNCNNGITSKDDLKILGGTYDIKATNHGIRGNDSVLINGGNIKIYCGNDGIKSTNETDADKGFIFLTGGNINIRATDDAVQAVTAVYVTDAIAEVACGGKDINCDGAVWTKEGSLTEVPY